MHSAFLAAALADGEQARQAPPGGAVLRIGENVRRAVGETKPRADDELQDGMVVAFKQAFVMQTSSFDLFQRAVSAHHARDTIAIRNANAGQAKQYGLLNQLLWMRRAAQEREICRDGELRISCRRFIEGRSVAERETERPCSCEYAVHEPAECPPVERTACLGSSSSSFVCGFGDER